MWYSAGQCAGHCAGFTAKGPKEAEQFRLKLLLILRLPVALTLRETVCSNSNPRGISGFLAANQRVEKRPRRCAVCNESQMAREGPERGPGTSRDTKAE